MRKVLIIGSAGAGKSTLAAQLAPLLGLPVIHLDSIFWQPNWVETQRPEWQQRVSELLKRDAWIMDGNYGSTMAARVDASDTVILLDLPRALCLYRVYRRAVMYWGRRRPDMGDGCREKFPDAAFIRFIWGYRKTRLPAIMEMLRANEQQKQVVVLRSPHDVAHFVNSLKQVAS